MSNDYAGNPASYPTTIRMPAGGENRSSPVFDRAFEDLADRTATTRATLAGILRPRDFIVCTSANLIDDEVIAGPNPQTVNNTPRPIYDLTVTPISAVSSVPAKAGDRFLIHVGPLFVVINNANNHSTFRLNVIGPAGTTSYDVQYDSYEPGAGSATRYTRQLVSFDVVHTVDAPGAGGDGLYTFAPFAWIASVGSAPKLTTMSPGVTNYGAAATFPTASSAPQIWGHIIHLGAE